MLTLTNNEVKTILENHHTGMLLLMPGSDLICPGDAAIKVEQKVQFGLNGCPKCLMYALRGVMEKEPALKKLIIDALSNKIV